MRDGRKIKMKTVANRLDLGKTRIAGFCLYCSESKDFIETTPNEVKTLINQGQVNGLKLVDGRIELDTENFNIHNLMIKSSVGRYRTLYADDCMVTCMYAVVSMLEIDNNSQIFEIINNRCGRIWITSERLKMLIQMGNVAGVRLVNGEIELCKGVSIENRKSMAEQTDNQYYLVVPEIEQLVEDTHIEPVPVQLDNNEVETHTKRADSLETIFDSLDVTKYSSEVNVNTEEATGTPDYTGENKEVDPLQEQVGEKKKVSDRKTKKK